MEVEQVPNSQQHSEVSKNDRIQYVVQVPFPCERYAEVTMRAIGVDPAFTDTKTKKSSIEREMFIEVLDNGTAYLTIKFSCPPADVNSMRTCASSFYTNLILVCQTIHEFGN